MVLGINKDALKSPKLWIVLVLTNIAIATSAGVILDGSKAAQVIAWVVQVLGVLGYRSWNPPAAEDTTTQA